MGVEKSVAILSNIILYKIKVKNLKYWIDPQKNKNVNQHIFFRIDIYILKWANSQSHKKLKIRSIRDKNTHVLPFGKTGTSKMEAFSTGMLNILNFPIPSNSMALSPSIRYLWWAVVTANFQIRCTKMGTRTSSILISVHQ